MSDQGGIEPIVSEWVRAQEVRSQIEPIVTEWLRAREIRDQADERLAALGEVITGVLGIGGRCELAPGIGVRVAAPARRLDPEIVAKYLTEQEIADVSRPALDSAAIREKYPDLVDEMTRQGGKPSVRLI